MKKDYEKTRIEQGPGTEQRPELSKRLELSKSPGTEQRLDLNKRPAIKKRPELRKDQN